MQVYTPSSSALQLQKEKRKKEKRKRKMKKKDLKRANERIKVTFCKGAYNVRTMQPSWFETVYLQEKEKKKTTERLFYKWK